MAKRSTSVACGLTILLYSIALSQTQPAWQANLSSYPYDTTTTGMKGFPIVVSNDTVLLCWMNGQQIKVARTTGGGNTWSQPTIVATSASYSSVPWGVRTATGRVLLLWSDNTSIRTCSSIDAGLTWSAPSTLWSGVDADLSRTIDGSLWLAYRPFPSSPKILIRSTDGGLLWGPSRLITSGYCVNVAFALGDGGSLLCFFENSQGYHLIKSSDEGSTWTSPVRIPGALRTPRVVQLQNRSITLLYSEYALRTPSDLYFDVFSMESSNGGTTWSAPTAFTRFVRDDRLLGVDVWNNKPFVLLASDRWLMNKMWMGVLGLTSDSLAPPSPPSASARHYQAYLRNIIRVSADDESDIASITARLFVDSVYSRAIQFFDDGMHWDGRPGDNSFGAWLDPMPPGFMDFRFVVTDISGNTLPEISALSFQSTIGPHHDFARQGSRMKVTLSNRGVIGRDELPFSNSPDSMGVEYPVGSRIEHVYGAGLWIGGIIDTSGTGQRLHRVSAAYEGWSGPLYEFYPTPSDADSIWRIFGRSAVKPPDWDTYWGAALPFKPLADHNLHCKYTDYDRAVTGHVPLGLKVIQSSYSRDDQYAEGIQLLDFKIINTSQREIDSVYVGYFMDADVGHVDSFEYAKRNFVSYRQAERFAFFHNILDAGSTPVGYHVLRSHRPLDSLSFAFRWWHGPSSPNNDAAKYAALSSGRIDPEQFPAFSDTRALLSFGPFRLPSVSSAQRETLRVAFAILCGMDLNQLIERSARAEEIYRQLTVVGDDLPDLPREFGLEQNFPNPFNPTTTIRYQIAKTSHAELKVFDILGRHVATLVNEAKTPGTYEATLDGRTLASGVYFYTLRAGDYVGVRKALLLK
ncbi:MAG: exo-alpha-sialidase [Ignavibacteriae bacterium]|nr:exo-alpha-sialidase [Ignavibacteriota bacterium]